MAITRIGTTRRWSDVVIYNGVLYSVEVPTQLSADLATQAREILGLIEACLVANGSDKTRILMATIYLQDISQIEVFNQIWDTWLIPGTAPVRACLQAQLAKPEYQVEVQIVAALSTAGSASV